MNYGKIIAAAWLIILVGGLSIWAWRGSLLALSLLEGLAFMVGAVLTLFAVLYLLSPNSESRWP